MTKPKTQTTNLTSAEATKKAELLLSLPAVAAKMKGMLFGVCRAIVGCPGQGEMVKADKEAVEALQTKLLTPAAVASALDGLVIKASDSIGEVVGRAVAQAQWKEREKKANEEAHRILFPDA